MKNLIKAINFAVKAHGTTERKYTKELYVTHPLNVVNILLDAGETREYVLIAAVLHDILEDVYTNNQKEGHNIITENFGETVCLIVEELTDLYTSARYPDLNRKTRKEGEAKRLAHVSNEAKIIKLADIIDNTDSIVKHDPGFAKVYLEEKRNLIQAFHEKEIKDFVYDNLLSKASCNVGF